MAIQVYAPQQFDPSAFATDPLGSAMGGYNAIQGARAKQLEQEQKRAEMLRAQQKAPLEDAFLQAETDKMRGDENRSKRADLDEVAKLAKTNPIMAAQMLRQMGHQATLEEVYDPAGGPPEQPTTPQPVAAPPPQGGTPMPDGAEFGGNPGGMRRSPETGGPQDLNALMKAAAPGGGVPSAPDLQRPPPQAPPPAGASPPTSPPSTPAAGATPQGTLLGYRLRANIGGQDVVLHDPLQERQLRDAERSRNAGMLKDAVGGDEKYAKLIAGVVAAGVDPKVAATMVSAMMEKDQADATRKEQGDLQRQQSDLNNRRMSGAIMAGRPSPEDRAAGIARGDMALVERAHENIKRGSAYRQLLVQGQSLRSAAENLNSSNPVRQADGVQQLSKYYHGGVPTQGVMEQINSHLAGKVDNLEQFWSQIESGQYGPEQLKNLRDATNEANIVQQRNVNAFANAVRKGLGPGNGFDAYGGRVNNMVKSDLIGQGIDPELVNQVPDVYADGDQATLGAKRPGRNPVIAARAAQTGRAAAAPAASGGEEFTITSGPHAGKKARRLPNGKAELLE